MFHCFIDYDITTRDGETVINDQFHFSAKTEKDIRNMQDVISILLNRLGIKHKVKFVYEPSTIDMEGIYCDEDIS